MNRELKFLDWFNKQNNLNLKKTEDQFDRYDFYDQIYIVELKIRDSYYEEKALQADKGLNLVQTAEAVDKIPLYIVADEKAVFIYNLDKVKLIEKPIVEMVAPVTTEFEKNKMITKYFYLLKENEATKIIRYEN